VTKAIALFGALVMGLAASQAPAVVLYDGSVGTAPSSQGWLSHYSLFGGTEVVGGGKTAYDATGANLIHGGYSTHFIDGSVVNPALPTLDRTAGYTVSVDLKELGEAHGSNDRSGLSLIALSSDLMGIELEFWPNEIWAQSAPPFTHSEGVAYDPTAASKTYDLTVSGSTYTLSANGTQILTGSLHDYSSAGLPYNVPSYIFLGDNTGSAQGAFEFSRLAVAVPEPVSALAALGMAPLLVSRRRR
jgi:hypothetical protein